MSNTLSIIGQQIKAKRNEQQMSLISLSEKAFGNPHAAKRISVIERGLAPGVEFATIEKLLVALGEKSVSLCN